MIDFQIIQIQQQQRKLVGACVPRDALPAPGSQRIPDNWQGPVRPSWLARKRISSSVLRLFGDIEGHADAPDDLSLGIEVRPDAQIVAAIAAGVFHAGRDPMTPLEREKMLLGGGVTPSSRQRRYW